MLALCVKVRLVSRVEFLGIDTFSHPECEMANHIEGR